jgi:hypothetical protein
VVVADAGAIGLGFVTPAEGGRSPDAVAGFGLTAGAPVIGFDALLTESSTGNRLAVRAGVALMDGRGSGTASGCVRTTGGVGSSSLIEPPSSWGCAGRCGSGERPVDGATAPAGRPDGTAPGAPVCGGIGRAAERSTT